MAWGGRSALPCIGVRVGWGGILALYEGSSICQRPPRPIGIAHRDLKPENILCESPDQVSGGGGRCRVGGVQCCGGHPAPHISAPSP